MGNRALAWEPETIAAGRRWHRRVWQVELFTRGICTELDAYSNILEEVADRTRFYDAAGRDLGIKSGAVPVGGAWDASPHDSPDRYPRRVHTAAT
jgi:hypothetical protein